MQVEGGEQPGRLQQPRANFNYAPIIESNTGGPSSSFPAVPPFWDPTSLGQFDNRLLSIPLLTDEQIKELDEGFELPFGAYPTLEPDNAPLAQGASSTILWNYVDYSTIPVDALPTVTVDTQDPTVTHTQPWLFGEGAGNDWNYVDDWTIPADALHTVTVDTVDPGFWRWSFP